MQCAHFSYADFSHIDLNVLQLCTCSTLQRLHFTILEKRPNLFCHIPMRCLIEGESRTAFGPQSNVFQTNLLLCVPLKCLFIQNSFGFFSSSTS